MKLRTLLTTSVVVIGVSAATAATAAAGGGPPITGTGTVAGADDIGTCNNTWAPDNLTKTFMLFGTSTPGVYSLEVKEQGSFVSNAGPSPGACNSGSNNGSTVAAGVTGKTTSQWDNTVTATAAPQPEA